MAYVEEEAEEPKYDPSAKELKAVEGVYGVRDWIRDEVMTKNYPEFNGRTLKIFLDDSRKRANSFTQTREELGLEDWQANVFTGTTRNKARAYVSSVSKTPPQIRITATNDENQKSVERADVMKNLVRHSYLYCQNPELDIFNDGWDCCIDGTVIRYDGYLFVKDKVQTVKSWNPATGEMEIEESEQVVEDRPIEIPVNVNDFLVADPYEPDVQKQPRVIWVQRMTLDEFRYEFGKHKNAKFVKTRAQLHDNDLELHFGPKWTDENQKDKVEVLRLYDKRKDKYCVVANGVLILESPLLWGRKQKLYPFAKTVFEPFANRKFFWGNSLPNIMMPHQDTENSLVNSLLDKTKRSVDTPMLVGMVNRDSLELEDEIVTGDRRIYVDDVNAVKPMPVAGVTQAEILMLQDTAQRLALASVDALQEGSSGQGVTAREIVIANERAAEIKGVFFMLLSDLWLQKVRLRITNIIMFYGRVGKRYAVPDSELSDGSQGTMEVRVGAPGEIQNLNRPVGYDSNKKPFTALDVEEETMRLKGEPTEIVVIPYDWLDGWEYGIEVTTESVYQKGKSLDMALETEKLDAVTRLFPDIFAANKAKFFSRLMRKYGDSPENYSVEVTAQAPAPGGVGELTKSLAAPAQPLPQLSGT